MNGNRNIILNQIGCARDAVKIIKKTVYMYSNEQIFVENDNNGPGLFKEKTPEEIRQIEIGNVNALIDELEIVLQKMESKVNGAI